LCPFFLEKVTNFLSANGMFWCNSITEGFRQLCNEALKNGTNWTTDISARMMAWRDAEQKGQKSGFSAKERLMATLMLYVGGMGVDYGGGDVGQVPQNLERMIIPPDFVMLQNFKHQITCITM